MERLTDLMRRSRLPFPCHRSLTVQWRREDWCTFMDVPALWMISSLVQPQEEYHTLGEAKNAWLVTAGL